MIWKRCFLGTYSNWSLIMKQALMDYHTEVLEFESFVDRYVKPTAFEWDKKESISKDILRLCCERGYFGFTTPKKYQGLEQDLISYGLFCKALGEVSPSLAALFNVHTMVTQTISKWGNEFQKNNWLIDMSSGKKIGAIALTEPGAGSDLNAIETTFDDTGESIIINGTKKWITFSGLAKIFLVFGKLGGKPTAVIVERGNPGLKISPITDMLGFRAAHLSVMEFNNVIVPRENLVGQEGSAFICLAPYALDFGKISVAWTALGILTSCLREIGAYAFKRKTFGKSLVSHGMIQTIITEIGVSAQAASHLCFDASFSRQNNAADATDKIHIAKYFASREASRLTNKAIQAMGAIGCNEANLLPRLFRDSKILEIVEGNSQVIEMLLSLKFARQAKRESIKRTSI